MEGGRAGEVEVEVAGTAVRRVRRAASEVEVEVEVEVASASASAVGGTSSRYSDDTQNEFSSAAFTLDIGRLGQPTSSHSLSRS